MQKAKVKRGSRCVCWMGWVKKWLFWRQVPYLIPFPAFGKAIKHRYLVMLSLKIRNISKFNQINHVRTNLHRVLELKCPATQFIRKRGKGVCVNNIPVLSSWWCHVVGIGNSFGSFLDRVLDCNAFSCTTTTSFERPQLIPRPAVPIFYAFRHSRGERDRCEEDHPP